MMSNVPFECSLLFHHDNFYACTYRAMKARRWLRALGLLKHDLSAQGQAAAAELRRRTAAAKSIQRW
jgi:hypothetical protein